MERTGSASFRIGEESIWRNDAIEMFSRSSREENDEEALKWAALEKLPTYDRIRKAVLTNVTGGSARVVDINGLGLKERQELIDRLIKGGEEENAKFLRKLRNRIDRVGIELPTIEVRYENLNVGAETHVGSRALPTFINFCINLVEGLLTSLHVLPSGKKKVSILKNVSGIIKPSRMTLLLGPPSSGKTTFLLALAGKLDPTLKVSGKVTYNGHEMDEFVPQRTAAYISQYDVHIGQLTVRETLEFSARCQGVGSSHGMLVELLRREKEANIKPDPDLDMFMKAVATEGQEASVVTDYILKILGLDVCADVIVGNEMLRGISGGQKKRLTTGEMLVGPAKALFMDEISTGLDSSTTFQIVNSLKQSVHILDATAVISLLQPAPETYELFDDIILLSEGQIVYQGPRENVLEFFEYMGFKCPERKGVADFLQEVTSKKDQEQYWARKDQPYNFVKVSEFAEAFQSFHVGKDVGDRLSVPFDKAKSHPAALTTERYGVRQMELLKACVARELLLLKRNSFLYTFKFFQLTIMALIASTLFLRVKMHRHTVTDGNIYLGALFYALVIILFNGTSEVSMSVVRLPVFYKQRDFLFYPAWAYSLPPWILKIPMTFIEVSIWVFITYYIIGFDPNVQRFWRFFLLLVLLQQMASSLFRCIAALGRNMTIANTFGSLSLLLLFALGGYILSKDDMKKWWIWAYWASPLMYAQNALAVNEYLGHSWNHIPPNSTETLGVQLLKSRGFFTEAYWYWIGVGALFGFTLLFNLVNAVALTFLDPIDKRQNFMSDDSPKEKRSTEAISDANQGRKRGMILPFEPHSLAFDNITYSVDMPPQMKTQGVQEDKLVLLKGVSGSFRPGVLTALMGISGAGKTTLMDVLAGRKTGGYIDGTITISGYPKKHETYARISGYCEQFDIHSPHVTVYESLVYSAWLRLPKEVDTKTRMMFVEEVMELVELTQLRQAMVGLPGISGLSTEQRKRLTIAVELVANPSIIFMDEPTSGLDARAAAIVMRAVRNTVDTGRTVVCTIHQPSIDIFESFDELFLLKRGGQEIYAGPLGHNSSELINYFQGMEGISRIKDGYNPAAWMLEVTSASQETALGIDFAEIYKNSNLYRKTKDLVKELSIPAPGSTDLHFPTKFSQSFLNQCRACLWKQRCSYWRNPHYTAMRFLFATVVAVVFGSMFWQLGSKTGKEQDLFNAMGSMYAAIFFLGIQNGITVQTVVSVERIVFYRERAAGMYSELPYGIAQVLVEIPYVFSQALVYDVIIYAMIGFEWTAAKFFWYMFFMYFTLLYFTYYGMMTVGLTPNYYMASIVSTSLYSIWNIFSGFIIPRTRIPIWWRWFSWANPFSWSLYGLLVSQYGQIHDKMDTGETVEGFLRRYFGFRHDFLPVVAVVIVAINVIFGFVFAATIKMFNFQRR